MKEDAKQLSTAIKIATVAHASQFDKGGMPYILHPLKVMYYLNTTDTELMSIAVLHDVIEDTSVTYHDLRSVALSDRIIDGVRAMTKLPGQTFEEYKDQVKANPDAVKVKMADLRHNTDLRRLKGVTEKDIARTVKYMEFFNELKAVV